MKSYTRSTAGRLWSRKVGGGDTFNTTTAYLESFSCSPGGKNDFHKPTGHLFDRYCHFGVVGSQTYPSVTQAGSVYQYDGQWGAAPATTHLDWNTAARTLAYNGALDDLNSMVRGEADLAMDLVFRKETEGMINAAKSFVEKAIHPDKKYGLQIAKWVKSPIKLAGNAWLAYSFGLKPSAMSIYQALQTVVGKVESGIVYEGKKTIEDRILRNVSDVVPWDSVSDYSCRCKFKIRLKPEMSRLQFLGNVTSLNPVSWAYEALPYSWMVDYVYDIGGYLRNLETALLHLNRFVDGFYTETLLVTNNQTQKGYSPAYGRFDRSYLGERRALTRTVLGSYPFPRKPSLDVDLGSGQLLNLAGLLATKLGFTELKYRRGPSRT